MFLFFMLVFGWKVAQCLQRSFWHAQLWVGRKPPHSGAATAKFTIIRIFMVQSQIQFKNDRFGILTPRKGPRCQGTTLVMIWLNQNSKSSPLHKRFAIDSNQFLLRTRSLRHPMPLWCGGIPGRLEAYQLGLSFSVDIQDLILCVILVKNPDPYAFSPGFF